MERIAVPVSALHELLVEMFIDCPGAVAELLGRTDGASARLQTNSLSTAEIAEQRADAIVVLGDPPDEIVIVEVQTSLDRSKPATWASYVGVANSRWRLPVSLLVLAVDQKLADYYTRVFDVGRCLLFSPLVIGPRHLFAHAHRQAKSDVTTMMAAVANPDDAHLGVRAFEFASTIDSPAAAGYTDLVMLAASPEVRALLEKLMRIDPSTLKTKYARAIYARFQEGHDKGREEGREEGLREGLRRGIEAAARARGLGLSDGQRRRLASGSLEELERWHARSFTATSAATIFK